MDSYSVHDEDFEEAIDVENLTGRSVSIEQLVGRNYYHYMNGQKDETQPAEYILSDLDLNESEDDDEDEVDGVDEDEEESEGLADYLPQECWVKRFVDEDNPDICYLLYLVIDEQGRISDSGCVEECSMRMGGGGVFFMIPGMELPSIKSYESTSYPPDKVTDDLTMLFAGRSLPLDYAFSKKRLPQKMIDEDGNGGSNTEYTFALQSAYRMAYMHMSIETDENGVIQGFWYSTYQSSGSAYGDMFSRPVLYSDRREEAIDMLLYIYDMYTEEELNR